MHKENEKLLTYNLVASLSGSLAAPFMAVYFYDVVGGSFFLMGLVNYAPMILSVIMGLIWARISDSKGLRKWFIVLSSATGIATTFALSFATGFDQLLAIRLLGTITGSAGGASFSALFAKTFRRKRGSSLGLFDVLGLVGSFTGSLLSGYLYSLLGFRMVLRIVALLNFIPLLLIASIREEREPGRRLSLRGLVEKPRIPRKFWRIYSSRLLITLPGALGGTVVSIYFLKYLGGTPQLWSTVAAINTVTGLSSYLYGRLADKFSVRQMFTLAGLGWTALYTGYFLAPNPYVFAAILAVPVWPAFWVAYRKALMDISDETERATFFATESLLTTIYGSVLGILASLIADLFHPRLLFLISAAAAAASTLAIQKLLAHEPGLKETGIRVSVKAPQLLSSARARVSRRKL